jgi:RNA polymerase sigma factor for flagellar operon FliA
MRPEPVELPPDAWERRNEKAIRDLIILAYWPMLTRIVGRMRQSLPQHVRVDEDDLRSYGLIGLYKALDRYDPMVGAFDKFASNFVRGAVLDELRTIDWAPRSLRKRQKDMDKGRAVLIGKLNREPTVEELAEELRWTVADISTTKRQVDCAWPRSLDEIRGEAEKDLYAVIADAQGGPEQHALGVHDSHENDRSTLVTERMAFYIREMPPQKKAVVVMCYYLDMRQTDVARALGIPESRVSSLHLSVMEEIHARLEDLLSTGDDQGSRGRARPD